MSKGPIAVSGVTGFIASQIVADLLAADYIVHGTARSISPDRLTHIASLPNAELNFRAFSADLMEPGSFDEALIGCVAAIHCASPYVLDAGSDAMAEIVNPAVDGTKNFLAAVASAGGVAKVVITSSIVAMSDHGHGADTLVTEDDWNTTSSASFLPYHYSKVLAERAAWDWAEKNPATEVVVINPFFVIGPSMVKSVNASVQMIKDMIDGKFPGILDLNFFYVDVRDVAQAHIKALESDNAKGRYICAASQKPMHMGEVIKELQEMGYEPRATNLSNSFVSATLRLLTSFSGTTDMQYIHNHVGNPLMVDCAKIRSDLSVEFRDPVVTLKETIADLIKWGHLEARDETN